MDRTSIIISKDTRERLKHFARKDETYDAAIQRMISQCEGER
jgi:hypothetical protein